MSEDLKVLKHKEMTYWRNNFFVVLLPFVFVGLPVHIILPSKRTVVMQKLDLSWRHWLEFRIRSPVTMMMTIILLPFYIFTNYLILSKLATLFVDIIIKGRLRSSDLASLLQLLYSVPFFIMVNYAWMYGHLLNYIIQTFDTPNSVLDVTASIQVVDNHPEYMINPGSQSSDSISMQVRNGADNAVLCTERRKNIRV